MPSQPKAQLHCRIDPTLKDWIAAYAQSEGREIGEVVEAKLQELKDQLTTDPTDIEEKRVERQLNDVQKALDELLDLENEELVRDRRLAYALLHVYPESDGNWRLIRIKALKDLNDGKVSWIKKFGVDNPLQIIDACRTATTLTDLRTARKDLLRRLGSLFGVDIEFKAPTQHTASSERMIKQHETSPSVDLDQAKVLESHQPSFDEKGENTDRDDHLNEDDWEAGSDDEGWPSDEDWDQT